MIAFNPYTPPLRTMPGPQLIISNQTKADLNSLWMSILNVWISQSADVSSMCSKLHTCRCEHAEPCAQKLITLLDSWLETLDKHYSHVRACGLAPGIDPNMVKMIDSTRKMILGHQEALRSALRFIQAAKREAGEQMESEKQKMERKKKEASWKDAWDRRLGEQLPLRAYRIAWTLTFRCASYREMSGIIQRPEAHHRSCSRTCTLIGSLHMIPDRLHITYTMDNLNTYLICYSNTYRDPMTKQLHAIKFDVLEAAS